MTVLSIEEHEMPALLAAAVNQAWPVGLGELDPNAKRHMTLMDASVEWLQDTTHTRQTGAAPFIDYLWGRRMKLEWAGGWVDSAEYDSIYGEGALERALVKARE